jgi:hypothetical protein
MAIAIKSYLRSIGIHRPWEDGVSFVLGVLVLASPWVWGPMDERNVVLNAVVVGLLICGASALEIGALQKWEEWLNLALGVWLVMSPPVFGYSHVTSLAVAHYALGSVIAILAALEYWQDSHRTTAAK